MISFQSTRALVIGGTRGIGLAVAQGLARGGGQVAVGARRIRPVAEALETLRSAGEVQAFVCDVTDPVSVSTFVQQAANSLGGIDILVNCATAAERETTEAGWRRSLETDLMGPVRALEAALPFLRRSEQAAVVNVSSISARGARKQALPYGAAKAALEQFTLAASRLHAAQNVRINCVAPGSTDFPGGLWNRIREEQPELYARTRDTIPLGRFANPEDIADAILFLASPMARWITGQCLVVDGGQLADSAV